MKRITGLLLALLFPLLTAAADIGERKHLLAYHNAQFCLPAGNEVYAVYDGNLLAYHPADGEVRLLSGLDGLSGKDIRFMGYSESEKCLVLVYANLLIDLLYPADGSVVSLPQISNSVTDGATANALFTDGEDFAEGHRIADGGFELLDFDNIAGFDGILLTAGLNDRVHG